MLQIALELADTEPVEFCEDIALPAGVGGDDALAWEPVHFAGRLRRSGNGYVVSGKVAGRGTLRCVRCLGEFTFAFEDSFTLHMLPVALAPREDEVQLTKKDLDVRFFLDPVLDLVELASEQVELLLPVKPLCREDCRGLCPRCGADLNQAPCACPPEMDERWRALLDFHPAS
ncbi:MAG: YceD family protein [Thermoanaerobaculum sp.]